MTLHLLDGTHMDLQALEGSRPTYEAQDTRQPIEALVVRSSEGDWRRVPDGFRSHVDLCSAELTYRLHGEWWRASCTERSEWVCGERGLCGRHFYGLLETGQR